MESNVEKQQNLLMSPYQYDTVIEKPSGSKQFREADLFEDCDYVTMSGAVNMLRMSKHNLQKMY